MSDSINEQKMYYSLLCRKTASYLENNNFDVFIASSKEEAIRHILSIIPSDASIGFGGSRTLQEIGFFDHFTKERYPGLYDRTDPDLTPDKKMALMKKAITADYFLASANAVSKDGELVFIDKWGNRTGPLTYGPGKRIIVVGANKISVSLNDALNRARDTASVLNNIRFETPNPCTKEGECMDCNSNERLCSMTTIIHRCQPPGAILVVLVEESLGF